jgi:mono/diheme cytochrome c family protein
MKKQRQKQPSGPAAGQSAPAQSRAEDRPQPGRSDSGADFEPTALNRAVPALLVGILGALLYWGDMYVMDHGGDLMGKSGSFPEQVYYPIKTFAQLESMHPKVASNLVDDGRIAFTKYCMICHQANGMGLPGQFPPLAGSEWVNAEGPNRIIRIVLDGFTGPVQIKGQPFNATMVPWRTTITDDREIAAVLTFIRQEWGNKASEVSTEKVTQIREASKSHAGRPWIASELESIPVND